MTADSRPRLRAVCLAGPSDSGKTTLVEELVPRLAEDDRVATVKSIHHDIEIDTPGADTHRHRTTGAETVVGITPELTFDITTRGKRDPPDELGSDPFGLGSGTDREPSEIREMRALASTLERLERRGYDIVLVEGFSASPLPTILVGDRSPADVGGPVIGRHDDGLETLAEAIRSVDPLEFERPAD
ncbi:molybdopterin-guanine dinucleotide biosynthesis protein B [Halopiger xanaduensis]|uniref:Molybdopterin-guanine dinucleotide biosynthesis protein B n=1 Tax=Halopiger xanaduensis (strain DSM 18323 / JCM 14033 / SH-6) TaxID=797210 RepID=F8D6R9_HALXS|nr:molybdopterin-guanine dinucleotide biosynthesis protein B [Halopiger xanaduensis]AEH37815.1 molybdopterin-guanine dinucleotide biosynthesis protein B [Halopiger xanaduensis SH-6]